MTQAEVALQRSGIEVPLDDDRLGITTDDFERMIGAATVDDQYFLGPSQFVQGAPNIRLLVEREDHRRDFMKQAPVSRAAPSREFFDIARRGALPFLRSKMRSR